MTTSLIIWLAVAVILSLLIIVRVISEISSSNTHSEMNAAKSPRRFRLVELGKEDEEFFIPGDNFESSFNDLYDSNIN